MHHLSDGSARTRPARTTAAALAAALLLAGCADEFPGGPTAPEAPSLSRAEAAPAEYVRGRILVGFAPGASRATIAAAHGASLQQELLQRNTWVLRVPAGREATVAAALAHNPNVTFAEPDYLYTVGVPCETGDCTVPSDDFFGYKWDLHNDGELNNSTGAAVQTTGRVDADIDWLEAFDQLGAFSGSAVIGVIDTGVYPDHPDLAGKVLAGYDFVNNDANAMDDDGHGTHVAGIAAAHGNDGTGVTGVAYGSNVRVLPVKVCGPGGCPSSAITNGITYAVDHGANVLNLSLGGRFGSTATQQALAYAQSRNVLPFCATGNDGAGKVSYPAAFPECVAVAATTWSDTRASYSNTGAEVEIAAPGGDSNADGTGYSYILSTYHDGGYVFMAGTSMATPQAAGLAALLHANGVTGAGAIRERIRATADPLGAARSFGAGRINVYRALNNLTDGGSDGGGDGGGEEPCRGGPKKCG